MNTTVYRLHSHGLLWTLLLGLVLTAGGCAWSRRHLMPLKEAEAVAKAEQDPSIHPKELSPWDRERLDQERRLELDRNRVSRGSRSDP